MIASRVVTAYFRYRPLQTILLIALIALGIGSLTGLLLFSEQLERHSEPALAESWPGDAIPTEILVGLTVFPIVVAALGIFIALSNGLVERKGDLAIMRSLGASRKYLFGLVLLEGTTITALGTLAGILGGHLAVTLWGLFSPRATELGLTGLAWSGAEWWLLVASLSVGLLASLFPAIGAYRIDIARTMARL